MNDVDDMPAPGSTAEQEAKGETGQPTSEKPLPTEIGGRKGPEPVRYGDWEKNGRCIDF